MSRILITGASGFLGKHLVEYLRSLGEGRRLRLLSRNPASCDPASGAEAVRGDVTRLEDVLRAAEGAFEVYHLAGVVSRDASHAPQLYMTHLEGTRNVCEAARRLGAPKVLVVSSSGTIAVGPEPVAHREDSGYKHQVVAEWPYYLSKMFAEKLAFDYQRRYGLRLVVVSPSLILGPGDNNRSSTGDVALFLAGQIMAIPRGGLNFVDVRDAARGLVAAMRSGTPGERYLLGGPNWTFHELIEKVAQLAGRHTPKLKPSLRFSLLSARLLRGLFPLAGKRFDVDDASIKMAALFWYCDSGKARRELGFETRDPVETLRDTIDDLRRQTAKQMVPSPGRTPDRAPQTQ